MGVRISKAGDGRRGAVALADLFAEVWDDLERVERELHEQLRSDNPLLVDLATHLLRGGGKRMRPALVLLAARPFDYQAERLVPAAAAVEMIHMATLLHDDIVDGSSLRRGRPTINAAWGEPVSVLLGDYLFARSFSMLAETGDNRMVRIMADVVFRMSGGELEQLTESYNVDRREDEYLSQIDKKTAYFIGECCRLGALVGDAPEDAVDAMRQYGYTLGMGFQIIDDILDLTASSEELGKPRGADLQSGVITLPVLYALRTSPRSEELCGLIGDGRVAADALTRVLSIVDESGGLQYAYEVAERYITEARTALRAVPAGTTRERLGVIADFVMRRRF